MAIPSLVLTPSEARTRNGTVTPQLSGAVESTADSWRLCRGIGEPTVLLSPGEYLTTPDAPTLEQHPDVSLTEGRYGDAWRIVKGSVGGFRLVPVRGAVTEDAGTIAGRFRVIPQEVYGTFVAMGWSYNNASVYMYYNPQSGIVSGKIGAPNAYSVNGGSWAEWADVLIAWGDGEGYVMIDGRVVARVPYTTPPFLQDATNIFTTVGGSYDVSMETYLSYDRKLGEEEAATLTTMQAAWSLKNRTDGTITVSHPQPVGDLLVRYREDGATYTARLRGTGRFGESGAIRHEGGELIVTTERELELLGVIAYPAEASVTPHGMAARDGEVALAGDVDRGDVLTLRQTPKGLGATMLLSPDGSHDRTGEITPEVAGGTLTRPGRDGTAWQPVEATKNHINNPAMRDNSGWTIFDVTPAPQPDGGLFGLGYTRITLGEGNANSYYQNPASVTTEPEQWWTWSFYARGVPGQKILARIYWYENSSPGPTANIDVVLTEDWQRYVLTAQAPAGVTNVRPEFRTHPDTPGSVPKGGSYEVCAPQLENKSYATPLAHGDMGSGYAWEGAPSRSPTFRYAGTVSVAVGDRLNMDASTIVMRVRPHYTYSPQSTKYPELISTYGGSGTARFTSFVTDRAAEDGEVWMYGHNGQGVQLSARSQGLTPKSPVDGKDTAIAFRWSPDEFGFLYEGGEATRVRENYLPNEPMLDRFRVGGSGNNAWQGLIEGVLTFDHALGDAEREYVMSWPGRWTWMDPGTITIPLPEDVDNATWVVYYRENGVALGAVNPYGPLGSHGVVDINGGDYPGPHLVVTTTRRFELLGVIVNPELEEAEAERIMATDVWRWNTMLRSPGAILVADDTTGPIGGVLILEDDGNMNVIIGGTDGRD